MAFPSREPRGGFRIGSRSSTGAGYGTGAARSANRYEGTACPPGEVVVARGADRHAPKYIGGPTSRPYVYCRPLAAPVAAPQQQAPPQPVQITTTVSPVLQTEVSPQISPVFQQTQDSPGAVQAGSPTQFKPGGMEATGGGSAPGGGDAMLEFLRIQSEQDAARRAEESARREQERRDRLAREEREREERRAFEQRQLDLQRQEQERAEAARQQQLEMQRLDQERRDAEAAGRAEEAAALQAQYQASMEEWQRTQAQAPTFVSTAAPAVPGLPAPVADAGVMVPPDTGPNWPLIAGIAAVVLVGGYALTTQTKGRKRK